LYQTVSSYGLHNDSQDKSENKRPRMLGIDGSYILTAGGKLCIMRVNDSLRGGLPGVTGGPEKDPLNLIRQWP
jgi:hypothetical protein